MNDRIPMFPTAQPPRADEDTAAIEQVIEQVPGEIELDKVIKAQTSAPQIVKRMVELENSIWSLVGILLLLPQPTRDKIGATEAIEQARSLLLRSMVLDHNLEIPAAKKNRVMPWKEVEPPERINRPGGFFIRAALLVAGAFQIHNVRACRVLSN